MIDAFHRELEHTGNAADVARDAYTGMVLSDRDGPGLIVCDDPVDVTR